MQNIAPLSRAIKKDRQESGITQAQLARALNVPAQTVNRWENDGAIPSGDRLNKIAAYFGHSSETAVAVNDYIKHHSFGKRKRSFKAKKSTTQQPTHVAPKKPSIKPENGSKYVIKGMVTHPTEFYASEGYVVIAQPGLDGYIFLTAAQAEEFIVWASNPEKLQMVRRFEKLNSMAFYKEN